MKMKVKEVSSSKKDVSKNLEALETENMKFKSDLKAATERYHQDTNSMKNDLQESKVNVSFVLLTTFSHIHRIIWYQKDPFNAVL